MNSSMMDPAVVWETIIRSLKIAEKCGKNYFAVTYDLVMAKIALRIQSAGSQLNKLFIQFGSFHIMLSFFNSIGQFIAGYGLTNILIDSDILVNGSANAFLTGKHFNQCKKTHPKLSLALKILHFQRFLQTNEHDLDQSYSNFFVS